MHSLEEVLKEIHPATLTGAFVFAAIAVILGIVGSYLIRVSAAAALRRARVDPTAIMFLRPLGQIVLWVILLVGYAHVIPSLRSLGTAMLAGASVISIVLGVAAQSTLGNLIAGIAILLYRPFRVGDRMQVTAPTGMEVGVVESVTLGYTVLQTYDNRRIVLPNSVASNQTTINLTSVDARILASIAIGIAYDSDVAKAREILLEIARAHPDVVETVGCPVIQLGASSVTLSLRAWCKDAATARTFEWSVYEEAKARFQPVGIEIPFPYMNVLVKSSA
jgi:small-conductance mechanosensitive channel